ncbi:MAG TPA: hypothetical protein VGF93_11825 [Solirubrobacteraceae bacterium]|jgi:hypothetical protein
MPRPKRLAIAAGCLVAIGLSACGAAVKPATGSRGVFDDPRTAKADRVLCISQHHLPVQKVGLNELLIGAQPAGPRVVFEATEGAAQGVQISGLRQQQGAEVIGGALLFPDQAPDQEVSAIETCLSHGVKG